MDEKKLASANNCKLTLADLCTASCQYSNYL